MDLQGSEYEEKRGTVSRSLLQRENQMQVQAWFPKEHGGLQCNDFTRCRRCRVCTRNGQVRAFLGPDKLSATERFNYFSPGWVVEQSIHFYFVIQYF